MALHRSDDTHLAGEECRCAENGKPYTFHEFVNWYGNQTAKIMWDSADIHRAKQERRLASDECSYTFNDFLNFYGKERGTRYWNTAEIHRAGEACGANMQTAANSDASQFAAQIVSASSSVPQQACESAVANKSDASETSDALQIASQGVSRGRWRAAFVAEPKSEKEISLYEDSSSGAEHAWDTCEFKKMYPSVRALLGLSADAPIPDGRDDQTLVVYDRLTFKNPYLPDDF